MAAAVSPSVYPEGRLPEQQLAATPAIPPSEVVGRRIALKRVGREWVGHCPFHRDRSPSFTVVDSKGFFHCFGCGAHGDAIEFVRRFERLSFAEAVERIVADASNPRVQKRNDDRRAAPSEVSDHRTCDLWWRNVWRKARPATGTFVETYLRSRGISVAPPAALRSIPRLRHGPSGIEMPAMVAAFVDIDGNFTGVHRTYLAPDGRAKANVEAPKRMAGRCWGAAIRLTEAAETLAIAEGIETGLSVLQAVPDLAIWVAGSLGNLAGAGRGDGLMHPEDSDRRLPTEQPDLRRPGLVVPTTVRRVIILADADGDPHVGAALIERALRKFQVQGFAARVAWPRPGMDFNDMLRGGREP